MSSRITFYTILSDEESYCKIEARTQQDAQRRAFKEFGSNGWQYITTDENRVEDLKEIEISPVEVSYGDYREEDLPNQSTGSSHKGTVQHDEIRSRNEGNN